VIALAPQKKQETGNKEHKKVDTKEQGVV